MNYLSQCVSIIIVTKNRPDMINRCLDRLYKQYAADVQIIVVDSSSNSLSKEAVFSKYPKTIYLCIPNGKNNRHLAKNLGIKNATGDIVAFLDDDSIVQDGWLEACVESYTSDDIGGTGGIIIDTNSPQEAYGTDQIGTITFNGTRIGNFNKDPQKIIEVEHLRGCNMSFRRAVLQQIGGFDLNYTGSNVLEETDLSVRVRKAGYKIIFNPKMAVIHTAAPRESILRTTFNLRREFYIARNSTYFMLKNFGLIRTLTYIFTNNTNIPAFIRKPKFNTFYCVFVSMFGKMIGLLAAVKTKIK
ncbi:MAG: glycosyltransferase [Candidatus Omnitrophica bacterium]|nr:glycosyltransferase [Candidatus Omnitrophota bacterium]